MIRTQISLDPSMYDAARSEARRLGISFAELCRRAIAQIVPPPDEPAWMRFAGTVELDDPDASSTVDEVVYGSEPS